MKVATPLLTVAEPSKTVPAINFTDPGGGPAREVTTAVKVTGAPTVAGFGTEVRVVPLVA